MDFKKCILKLSTCDIITILKNQQLNLDEEDLKVVQKTKISGSSIFGFKNEHFYNEGLAIGPTIAIIEFIDKIKIGVLI